MDVEQTFSLDLEALAAAASVDFEDLPLAAPPLAMRGMDTTAPPMGPDVDLICRDCGTEVRPVRATWCMEPIPGAAGSGVPEPVEGSTPDYPDATGMAFGLMAVLVMLVMGLKR